MALTAVVTDHWIVPTDQALPFVSHAGLSKVCFTAAATQADGRDASNVDTFNDIDDWWSAVSESYLDVPDRRVALQVGCTRTVAELYAHVWGEDRLAWLQICRAFAVLYLWCGFLKVATVTRNYAEASAGRWLSSALAVFLAGAQLCFGEAAWFLFLAIVQKAMTDAPDFLDRGTFENYEGWSFWAFFAAVQFTALCTSMYLFVEVATGCVADRKRRFAAFDWRGGRRVRTYHRAKTI